MMTLSKVGKRYGQQETLVDIDLDLRPGSLTAFIGPNGAGKSTLMSIMSRLIAKDSGQVVIKGTEIEVWNNKELAKELTMLKQFQHYQARLRVEDLVAFGRFPYSANRLTDEDRQKIDEALEYLQLTTVRERYIDTLSGGQLQRVFIAMVLAQDTDLILLDEPLNNLDIKQSISMMKILRDLVDRLGKTVVIVIHDINIASQYADDIVAFKEGRVYCAGKTEEVMKKEVLDGLFEMSVSLAQVGGKTICIYQ